MGDVVQLPVRRERLHESEQQTAPPRGQRQVPAPIPAPIPAPVPAPVHTPGRAPSRAPHETEPVVEPLWRDSVGRELREERLASGRRLVDVAEEAGVSPQYLSEVERGLKDPSSELLAAIAGALGLRVAEIATRVASSSISPQSPVCLAA